MRSDGAQPRLRSPIFVKLSFLAKNFDYVVSSIYRPSYEHSPMVNYDSSIVLTIKVQH